MEMLGNKIAYIDHHGDLCLSEKEDVRICVGSHHKITIDKMFGPACVEDLRIVWDGNDWNVRTKNAQLRLELRREKQKFKEFIRQLKKDLIQEVVDWHCDGVPLNYGDKLNMIVDKLAGEKLWK